MGGRGKESGKGSWQYSINEEQKRKVIENTLQNNITKMKKTSGAEISNDTDLPYKFKKCACCDEYTIPAKTKYKVCSVCGWIDDPYQNRHPYSLNGRNPITLNQARIEYQKRK